MMNIPEQPVLFKEPLGLSQNYTIKSTDFYQHTIRLPDTNIILSDPILEKIDKEVSRVVSEKVPEKLSEKLSEK